MTATEKDKYSTKTERGPLKPQCRPKTGHGPRVGGLLLIIESSDYTGIVPSVPPGHSPNLSLVGTGWPLLLRSGLPAMSTLEQGPPEPMNSWGLGLGLLEVGRGSGKAGSGP
jgi:hypothetical protein